MDPSVPGRTWKATKMPAWLPPVHLRQESEHDRPERPVLLQVDQQLPEGARLRVAQNSPIRSGRSKSGSMRTWSSSARGGGSKASRRWRRALHLFESHKAMLGGSDDSRLTALEPVVTLSQ
jgi:hypothetical protein